MLSSSQPIIRSLPVATILFNLWKSMSLQSLVLSNNRMCPKLKQSFSRKSLPHSDPPQISWQWQGHPLTRSQIPGRSSISPFCSHYSIRTALCPRKSPQMLLHIPTNNLPATIPILAFPTHMVRPPGSSLNQPFGIVLSEVSHKDKDEDYRTYKSQTQRNREN